MMTREGKLLKNSTTHQWRLCQEEAWLKLSDVYLQGILLGHPGGSSALLEYTLRGINLGKKV